MRFSLFSAALLASGMVAAAAPVDGMYTRVFGGYTYLPDNVSSSFEGLVRNHSSYNGGYNVGGAFGYQSNPLRYEVEYTYLSAGARRFYVNYIEQTGVSGSSSANLLMANIYYDFPELVSTLSPYVGIGLGYAYLQSKLDSTGPNGRTYFDVTANEFAYQATAGLTYNFAENYALHLNYRYVATDSARNFGKVFQANLASAGVIYRFDQGNYK